MSIAVVLAGGSGLRYGSSIPKQYAKLNGIPTIDYVLSAIEQSNIFKNIVIVGEKYKSKYDFVSGGNTRNQSIKNALEYCKKYNPRNIVFFDAVRPLLKSEDIFPYISGLRTNDAVITVQKISDSLIDFKNLPLERNLYYLVQTPEAFNFQYLYDNFKEEKTEYTAIVHHLPPNSKILHNHMPHLNLKLTYSEDLYVLESLLKYTPYKKNNINLDGKKALVLGGSGCLGSALIKKLTRYGVKVTAPSHSDLDITKDFSLPPIHFDIIVSCAGTANNDGQDFESSYNSMLDTNVKGVLNLLRKITYNAVKFPGLPRTNVVLISSSASTKGRPNFTIYSLAKAAMNSLSESVSEECKKSYNVVINTIIPEKIESPMALRLHGIDINPEELLSPEEAADAIINYCDTDICGQLVHIRKGFNYD